LRRPQSRVLRSAPPPLLSSAVELDQSPFFPQEDFQCGPAALATTLNAVGIGVTPEELARQVFLPAAAAACKRKCWRQPAVTTRWPLRLRLDWMPC